MVQSLHAAYQGKGWQPRNLNISEEYPYGVNSEYSQLESVLLYIPGKEIHNLKSPNKVQHLSRINYKTLRLQFDNLVAAYKKHNISVHFLDNQFSKLNLMYARDLFFNTPRGAIIARMASNVRAGEELEAAKKIVSLNLPIRLSITENGTFEGADALWVSPKKVVVGLKQRTNNYAFNLLSQSLNRIGVEVCRLAVPNGVQHLLGVVQIIDKNLVLIRTQKVNKDLVKFFNKNKFEIIAVPESKEITDHQGMNIVTIAPRKIVMPTRCEKLQKTFLSAGLDIAAEIDISEPIKGGGGLACLTGILSRKLI